MSTRNEIRTGGYIACLERDRRTLRLGRLLVADLLEAQLAFEEAVTEADQKRTLVDLLAAVTKVVKWGVERG